MQTDCSDEDDGEALTNFNKELLSVVTQESNTYTAIT
jgi:hypothetical protein